MNFVKNTNFTFCARIIKTDNFNLPVENLEIFIKTDEIQLLIKKE